jgi:hypothetical protein
LTSRTKNNTGGITHPDRHETYHYGSAAIMNLLRDIPAMRSIPCTLDAALYNHVRLALLRIGNPLELELGSIAIDVMLENACWIGYYSYQTSLPLIAWNDFEQNRSALDAPVRCTMHLYHQHSWLQMPNILAAMDEELRMRLAAK